MSNTIKDPDEWTTGDEPMTGAQASYLETLATEAGEDVPDDLTKADASRRSPTACPDRSGSVLIYVTNCSLDGFTEDADGDFQWSEPDEELHQFFNDLMRPIGTQLLGRRMYETMAVWETDPSLAAESPVLAG